MPEAAAIGVGLLLVVFEDEAAGTRFGSDSVVSAPADEYDAEGCIALPPPPLPPFSLLSALLSVAVLVTAAVPVEADPLPLSFSHSSITVSNHSQRPKSHTHTCTGY